MSHLPSFAFAAMTAVAALVAPVTSSLAAGGESSVASAARSTCAGNDLRPRIEAASPGSLESIAGQSAENGDARLWRVTSEEGAVSHLYGTMHVADAAIVALGPEAREAYEAAETVVIETTDILDQQSAAAAMMGRPDLMFFTDGTDLTDLLDDEQEAVLTEAFEARGIALASVRTFKPWILSAQLALPACMTAGGEILDIKLAKDAMAEGRDVRGLETAVEQMEAMASLPLAFHAASLVDAAQMGDVMEDVFATMGLLYAEGRIGEIWPMMAIAGEALGYGETSTEDADDLLAFEEAIVTKRNHTMAERSEEMLQDGGVFLAVGALHLPGEEGLVSLLRERGFEVDKVAR